jgi:hypothetical protein
MASRRRIPSRRGSLRLLAGTGQSGAEGAIARLRGLRPVPEAPGAQLVFDELHEELPPAAGEWEGRPVLRLVEPGPEDAS